MFLQSSRDWFCFVFYKWKFIGANSCEYVFCQCEIYNAFILMYMLSSCQGRKYSWDKCLKLFLVVISLMWFFNAIFRGAKNAPFQFI